jgi:hypothetical protein
MTKFILSKKIDNEWYTYGTYTEKNIDTLCDAYSECKRVAEDVHVTVAEETPDLIHCEKCARKYFKDMDAYCPYRVGPVHVGGYCEKAVAEDEV